MLGRELWQQLTAIPLFILPFKHKKGSTNKYAAKMEQVSS